MKTMLFVMLAIGTVGTKNGCAACASAIGGAASVVSDVSEVDKAERQRALERKVELMEDEQRVRAELARTRARADARERELERQEARAPKPVGPAAPPAVLAVFDLEPSDVVDAETARTLTELVFLELAATERHALVPLERAREAVVEAERESTSPCYDDGCQIDLGKALAAGQVVRPVLLPDDHGCIFGLDVYDLTRETREWAHVVRTGCDADALSRAARTVARELPALGVVRAAPSATTAGSDAHGGAAGAPARSPLVPRSPHS